MLSDALIMAGGLGLRLRPITDDRPKPMVEVGGKPILDHIVQRLAGFGFHRVWISLGYKGDQVADWFGDGSNWGIDIRYVQEASPLGTGGALRLLRDVCWPLLVLNGDVLADVDYRAVLAFHVARRTYATMCVRELLVPISYGVVQHQSGVMLGIEEKPVRREIVNTGIYVLSQEALRYMPDGAFGMPELFENMLWTGFEPRPAPPPAVYVLRGSWQDIGSPADLNHAQRMANVS